MDAGIEAAAWHESMKNNSRHDKPWRRNGGQRENGGSMAMAKS